jgi:hypothetical protein
MSNKDRAHIEQSAWMDVPAYANVYTSQSRSASFAKSFLFSPEDGRIYRQHYSGSIDPFDVVPQDLFDWPEVD